jgi:hypothetical protein
VFGFIPLPPSPREEYVNVKTVDGDEYKIPYNEALTGLEIKKEIFLRTGHVPQVLSLIYRGREINNSMRLSDSNFQKGETVTDYFLLFYIHFLA